MHSDKPFDIELIGGLPQTNQTFVGGRVSYPVAVSIEKTVVEEIQAHATSTLSVELGGFLLGHTDTEKGITYVVVTAMVVAEATKEDRGSITFTHETWERFHQRKQLEHPNKKTVGWYHTHPGYGVFMSTKDQFIQSNFFKKSSDIALVVDPSSLDMASAWGIFTWREQRLERCPFFAVYSKEPKDKRSAHSAPPPYSLTYGSKNQAQPERIELTPDDFADRVKQPVQPDTALSRIVDYLYRFVHGPQPPLTGSAPTSSGKHGGLDKRV